MTHDELKQELKNELRAELEREYLLSLPNNEGIKEDATREVMDELKVELLRIEGREYSGDDVYRERFIEKALAREEMVRILNEPIDWGEITMEFDPDFGK